MSRHAIPRDRDLRHARPRERREKSCPLEYSFRLTDREVETLRTVGTFRIVEQRDLSDGAADKLLQRGLLVRTTLRSADGTRNYNILALTAKGAAAIDSYRQVGDRQRIWVGEVKPREVEHDLALLRVYRKEREEIERGGGKVQRVVVDYELKSRANAVINRPGIAARQPSEQEKAERRQAIAQELSLPVINGKLQYPDVRIEYLDKNGQEQHLDAEHMTASYRGAMRAAKHASGFKLHYGGGRSAITDRHEGAL
jgi:hypothetical protein